MQEQTECIESPSLTIRRLGAMDAAHVEAHYRRLAPYDALNLLGAHGNPIAIKRYLAGMDFDRDIILAAFDPEGAVRATVRVRGECGSRWAELLPAREQDRIAAMDWRSVIRAAVEAARGASVGWLSVASLGYDPETRDALKLAGFDLQADEEGTVGELRLGHA